MSASADAFRAAKAEIEEAKRSGAEELDFSADAFRALDVLPPETGDLDRLRTLNLDNTQVSHLAPLQELTGLYQRPFQLTCAHDRSVIEVTVLGSLAKRFHAVQQASRIAS